MKGVSVKWNGTWNITFAFQAHVIFVHHFISLMRLSYHSSICFSFNIGVERGVSQKFGKLFKFFLQKSLPSKHGGGGPPAVRLRLRRQSWPSRGSAASGLNARLQSGALAARLRQNAFAGGNPPRLRPFCRLINYFFCLLFILFSFFCIVMAI